MANLTVDAAHLLGLFIGILLQGLYLALFSTCLYQIHHRARDSKFVLTALWSLCILSSGYYILAAVDIFRAFVSFRETRGTLLYLSSFHDGWISAAKDILFVMSVPIADGLLAFRLYVIWPTNRIALIIVGIVSSGLLVSGFFIGIYELLQAVHEDGRFVTRINNWTIAGSAMIIVNNVIMTGCIAGRLWWMGRQVAFMGQKAQSLYHRITFILVNSGAIYLALMVCQILLYESGIRSAIYLFLHISPAIVAIFPTAIILQLNMQSSRPTTNAAVVAPAEGSLSTWAVQQGPRREDTEGSGGSDTATSITSDNGPRATNTSNGRDLDLELGMTSKSSVAAPSLLRGPTMVKFEDPKPIPEKADPDPARLLSAV